MVILLTQNNQLLERGLISEDQFNQNKQEIVNAFIQGNSPTYKLPLPEQIPPPESLVDVEVPTLNLTLVEPTGIQEGWKKEDTPNLSPRKDRPPSPGRHREIHQDTVISRSPSPPKENPKRQEEIIPPRRKSSSKTQVKPLTKKQDNTPLLFELITFLSIEFWCHRTYKMSFDYLNQGAALLLCETLNITKFFQRLQAASVFSSEVVAVKEIETNYRDYLAKAVVHDFLDLSHFSMTRLPAPLSDQVFRIGTITRLSLANNFLTKMADQRAIFSFQTLQYLDISKNGFQSIDATIQNLTNLKSLNVQFNRLSSADSIIGCTNLNSLQLDHNEINLLIPAIGKLTNLEILTVEGNSLKNVPDKQLHRGGKPLLGYLMNEICQPGEEEWNALQVHFFGPPGVGKSSLIQALVKQRTPRQFKTMGIEISMGQLEELRLRLFEYSGDRLYNSIHHTFISPGGIAVILYNCSSPDFSTIEYWLQILYALQGGTGKGFPILIIGLFLDKFKGKTADLEAQATKIGLLKYGSSKYVSEICWMSNKTGKNKEQFKQKVLQLARTTKKLATKKNVPCSWIQFRKFINRCITSYPFLYWQEYVELAGLYNNKIVEMTAFFHQNGILLWHQQAQLQDIVILDMELFANAMASLITAVNEKTPADGILDHSILPRVWANFPDNIHKNLVCHMMRFGVIHPIISSLGAQSFVPCLFPDRPSDGFLAQEVSFFSVDELGYHPSENGVIRRIERSYKFTFLPQGLFSKLCVDILQEIHSLKMKSEYWKNGMIFHNSEQKALISLKEASGTTKPKQNPFVFKILIVVLTPSEGSEVGDLFPLMIRCIESMISTSLNQNSPVKRKIPCPHCYIHQQPPTYFQYHDLIEAFSAGLGIVYCEGIPIYLEDIAPDVCLANVAIIKTAITDKIQIGEGTFGLVYKATIGSTVVALKEQKPADSDIAPFQSFLHEVNVMSHLNHPCLVSLFGITIQPLSIVLEFCGGGTLANVLHVNPIPLSPILKYKISLDVARGLSFLHHQCFPPIIHRDLRTPNIFISSLSEAEPVCCKIGDFGLAQYSTTLITERLKTWRTLAPEVIDLDSPQYDTTSDLFSYGMILYEIFEQKLPYEEYDQFRVVGAPKNIPDEVLADPVLLVQYQELGKVDINNKTITIEHWRSQANQTAIMDGLRPTLTSFTPDDVKVAIRGCWHGNPRMRPNSNAIAAQLKSWLDQQEAVTALPDVTSPLNSRRFKAPRRIGQTKYFELPSGRGRLSCVCHVNGTLLIAGWNNQIIVLPDDLPEGKSVAEISLSQRITCFHVDQDTAAVYGGGEAGSLFLIKPNLEISEFHFESLTTTITTATSLLIDSKKHLMVGTNDGQIKLFRLNGLIPSLSGNLATPNNAMIMKCIQISNSEVWVASLCFIYLVHLFKENFRGKPLSLRGVMKASKFAIKDLLLVQGEVWVATHEGITRLDPTLFDGTSPSAEMCLSSAHPLQKTSCVQLSLVYPSKHTTFHIWSLSANRTIHVWDPFVVPTPKCLEMLVGNVVSENFLQALKHGTVVTGSSLRGSFSVWSYLKSPTESSPARPRRLKQPAKKRNPFTTQQEDT